MIKYNAFEIKMWIIGQITPMGWSVLITRALPELLEVNGNFSAYYVDKNTRWTQQEINIINWYMLRMYQLTLPKDIVIDNAELEINYFELVGFNIYAVTKNTIMNATSSLRRILNI